MPETFAVQRVSEGDLARVAGMLARAFQDDPEMVYALPDASERARVLPWLIGTNVRYGHQFGEVYATIAGEGAAIWLPPGATTFTAGRMLRAGMFAAPLRLRWSALRRLAAMGGRAARMHQRYAPRAHWYLAQIGVEPESQGQGAGSALLRAMLSRIDGAARTCYLETSKAANVDFYSHHGFAVVATSTAPQGPGIWAMLRAPGAIEPGGRSPGG